MAQMQTKLPTSSDTMTANQIGLSERRRGQDENTTSRLGHSRCSARNATMRNAVRKPIRRESDGSTGLRGSVLGGVPLPASSGVFIVRAYRQAIARLFLDPRELRGE